MIRGHIVDGRGSDSQVLVGPDGSLRIMESPLPPFGAIGNMRVFRQYLTADGTSSGSNDMVVDGSSTNVDFWIPASETKDRYICAVSFLIVDKSATLNDFGTLSALTNGCRFFYEDEEGEVDIHEALKSNLDMVRLCLGQPAFGDDATAFRAGNSGGAGGLSEAFLPVMDLRKAFGFRWGIRLAVGTKQKLTFRIRDVLTGLDRFDVIAYGFERSEG